MTASGSSFTASATEAITSSATANTVKVTINKDGSAYSGLTVAILKRHYEKRLDNMEKMIKDLHDKK